MHLESKLFEMVRDQLDSFSQFLTVFERKSSVVHIQEVKQFKQSAFLLGACPVRLPLSHGEFVHVLKKSL